MGELYYCVLLDPAKPDRITKEADTNNCLRSDVSTSLGIMECAQSYCMSELTPKNYKCLNKVGIFN